MNEEEKKLHAQILAETQAKLQEQLDANKAELSDELAPFNDISMEQWAGINAELTQSQDLATMIASVGLDMSAWDVVNTEWNERMARDTTATIATVYGQAFTGAGEGEFGVVSENISASMASGFGSDVDGGAPVSFEQWVKITEHMKAASPQGIDSEKLLNQYDMTAGDWVVVGGYWGQKMNENPLTYLDDYQKFQEKYSAEFS